MPVLPEKGPLKVVVLAQTAVGAAVGREMGGLLHLISLFKFCFCYEVNVSNLR